MEWKVPRLARGSFRCQRGPAVRSVGCCGGPRVGAPLTRSLCFWNLTLSEATAVRGSARQASASAALRARLPPTEVLAGHLSRPGA